jgi:hypothetical protein
VHVPLQDIDDLLRRAWEDGYNDAVPKTNCTNRAEWQFQIRKPAERLSPHYRLDCEFGSPLMLVWGSAESEPIYLCEEHGKEFGSSAKVRAATSKLAGEFAEGDQRETSGATEQIGSVKSVLSAAFEDEESISGMHRERTPAAPFSAERSTRPLGEGHPHLFTAVAAALLLVTLATASAFLFNTHRREAGELLIRWGERLEETADASASQPPIQAAEGSTSSLASSTPGAALTSSPIDKASTGPARIPVAAAQAAASPSSSGSVLASTSSTAPAVQKQAAGLPSGTSGNEDVSTSQRDSEGTREADSSATAAPLLWTKVAKGSPAAEIKLARLYLRGNGVGKSCEQARVLLQAASAKGYTEAKHMLVALDEDADTDC